MVEDEIPETKVDETEPCEVEIQRKPRFNLFEELENQIVVQEVDPPKLYSSPTIQSRSAARRAAQDLVSQILQFAHPCQMGVRFLTKNRGILDRLPNPKVPTSN